MSAVSIKKMPGLPGIFLPKDFGWMAVNLVSDAVVASVKKIPDTA